MVRSLDIKVKFKSQKIAWYAITYSVCVCVCVWIKSPIIEWKIVKRAQTCVDGSYLNIIDIHEVVHLVLWFCTFLASFLVNNWVASMHIKKFQWWEWISQKDVALNFIFYISLSSYGLFHFPIIHNFRDDV